MADDREPTWADVVHAFQGPAPDDVVERGPADPDALRALHAIPKMSPVTIRLTEVTEHGVEEFEVQALFAGVHNSGD